MRAYSLAWRHEDMITKRVYHEQMIPVNRLSAIGEAHSKAMTEWSEYEDQWSPRRSFPKGIWSNWVGGTRNIATKWNGFYRRRWK